MVTGSDSDDFARAKDPPICMRGYQNRQRAQQPGVRSPYRATSYQDLLHPQTAASDMSLDPSLDYWGHPSRVVFSMPSPKLLREEPTICKEVLSAKRAQLEAVYKHLRWDRSRNAAFLDQKGKEIQSNEFDTWQAKKNANESVTE